jgi:hypothetical protein
MNVPSAGPFGYITLRISHVYRQAMPVNPRKTKKAIQNLSRVFNRLAAELSADLNQAIREIESLKREIQVLKSAGKTSSVRNRKSSPRKTKQKRISGIPTNPNKPSDTTHSTPNTSSHSSHTSNETVKPNEESPFVFPQEPYNPPTPPEPTMPGNN